ncbi:MAG: argininosuccinate lyase [Phycisphaerales bacterium]
MSKPLWHAEGRGVDERAMQFMAGQDARLDAELLPFDIRATRAHVRGLGRISALSAGDVEKLVVALDQIAGEVESGKLAMSDRFEDGHSAIEFWLTERLGEVGKRVHLGRSRNDQVLIATRLYCLDRLGRLRTGAVKSGRAALRLARRHESTLMPGYTHLQRAMPSSVGLWMGSFAESFADDAELVRLTEQWLDASPLGAAAGYGVNLPLDRDRVAEELGLARLHVNPMHAQATRGKHEHQALAAAWQVMQTVRRLAWDLSLFTTAEFGFVRLPGGATTGSSIMPNKRNPDLAELLRAAPAVVAGCIAELQQLLSLPSGYHRDLQGAKPPLIRGLSSAIEAVGLIPWLIDGLEIDAERMRAACDPTMLATDRAVELAAGGMPFRDAYKKVAESLGEFGGRDPEESLRARVSLGATADLRLDEIEARLDAFAD